MPTRLGASLPIRSTLGYDPRSPLRPSDGNGFRTGFREDLALLAEWGVTDLRLGADWARLQPRPGTIDDDWREWYQDVLVAARALGIDVWLGLLEQSVPAWFDDDGGFTDAKTAGRWFPRWVEVCTEVFGELVAGWFPLHDPIGVAAAAAASAGAADGSPRHLDALTNVVIGWRDAWRVLEGGPPVATSLGIRTVRALDASPEARTAARREDHLRFTMWLRALRDGVLSVPTRSERPISGLAGSLDVLGIALGTDLADDTRPDDGALLRWQDRAGRLVRRVAEEGPSRPLMVTYRARRADDDERKLVVESLSEAVHTARRDGVEVRCVFWEPGIDGVHDATGPIGRDRDPKPSAGAWATLGIETAAPAVDDGTEAAPVPD